MSDRPGGALDLKGNPHPPRGAWMRVVWIALFALLLAGCGRPPLYSALDEQQANELMAALLGSGIDADKTPSPTKVGWQVSVARKDIPYAMQVLHARGLPRAQYASLGEIFKKEGFSSSAMDEKVRYTHGLNQELSRTLSMMPGVVDARVLVALPERDPLGGSNVDSSASVMIFEQAGANVRDRETDIKVLVKDSIEGLDDVNKVTVKFATVPAANPAIAGGPQAMRMSMSSISPLAIAIAIGVIVLGLLGGWLLSRLRARQAAAKAPQPAVWNG